MNDVRVIDWYTYGETLLHPVSLAAIVLASIITLLGRRTHVALCVLATVCLIPMSQRVVVADLDFPIIRILLIVAWARVLARGEQGQLHFTHIDRAFIAWLVIRTIIHPLREGTLAALVFRLGNDFDALGTYFLFRTLLTSAGDVTRMFISSAWITFAVAIGVSIEGATGRNLFSVFGGVPELTEIRDGRLRCQGAFMNAIHTGSYSAGLLPIYATLALAIPRDRFVTSLAALACLPITLLSASSGPVIAFAAACSAWPMWYLRHHLSMVRWSLIAVLLLLHVIRERPVWHLVLRLGQVLGGTGYHRYNLIDAFVNRFSEWWLIGISSTAHWGWGLQDITNHYIFEALRGGLVSLLAFLYLQYRSFQAAGATMWLLRARATDATMLNAELIIWGMGASLATHSVSFISVAYTGAMEFVLYILLAAVTAFTLDVQRSIADEPNAPAAA